MKMIALFAVIATLISAANNKSSVGGPLTMLLIDLLAIGAVSIHQAYASNRSALRKAAIFGLAIIGGLTALTMGSATVEFLLSMTHFEGSLAGSNQPLLFILSAITTTLTVLGAWSAAQVPKLTRIARPQ